jgi:hypothetical protein
MHLPSLEFGTIHLKLKGFQCQNTKIELPTVYSLQALHEKSG